jgi:glycosyltransferase involved in cell wall biosynthesis
MHKEKCDLVIADMSNASLYGYLLSKIFRVPWIYSSRNVEYRRHLEGGRLDRKKNVLVPLMYFAEKVGSKAHRLLTVSELDASHFRKWTDPNKVVVIPSGFDESIYHPYYEPIVPPRPTVLFFGAFTHLPNREASLIIMKEILPRVVEKLPDVRFQFAGPEPLPELVNPNTEVLGFVSDLVEKVRRASVVIAPILSGGGMRTKIIEALACGKIVISTVKGAEGIGQYRNLLRLNIQEFPNEICRVIREGCLRDETDFESLRKTHSWGEILGRLDQCVKELLGQTRGDTKR